MSISSTIPASAFVAVNPAVIGAGGASVALNGLMLTNGTRVPIGSVLSFPSTSSVSAYFGPSAKETAQAAVYFSGFTNSDIKPGALLFAQYPTAATSAYLRGGNVSGLTVAQLEALSGTLLISVNGVIETSSAINLSSSGTFSLAAAAIQSGFGSFVGTVTYDSIAGAFVFNTTATGGSETISYAISGTGTSTASSTTGTVMTIGGTVTGFFNDGDNVVGTDSTNSLPAGTTIVNQLTGTTGKAGTYTISAAGSPGNLTSTSIASYGPTGTFAVGLGLTQATGAVLSQGSAVATPVAYMNNLTNVTTNWASFLTLFNPDASGNTNKVAFALWTTQQNDLYTYLAWDADILPTESTNASTSLGQILIAGNYSGTAPIYEPSDLSYAAFVAGAAASINFNETNGNTSFGFKFAGGITPSVSSETVKANLQANGYNFYCITASGNQEWSFFYPGTVSGPFLTLQNYYNQIWLNRSFQISLMDLLTTVKAVPYVQAGYALIEAAMQNNIQAALNFGMIQPGVVLSPSEIAEVNYQAGANIAGTLQTAGYYLQILDPGAIVRGESGSPTITFWYTGGGSVLQINLASIDVI